MTRLAFGAKWSGSTTPEAVPPAAAAANSLGCIRPGERDRAEAERRAAEERAAGDQFVGLWLEVVLSMA